MTNPYINKNAPIDGRFDASRGLGNRNQYNPGSASWKAYEAAYNTTFTPSDKAQIKDVLNGVQDDLDDALFTKLYEHFCTNNEMPYGVAKARDGDPHQWIGEHMHVLVLRHESRTTLSRDDVCN